MTNKLWLIYICLFSDILNDLIRFAAASDLAEVNLVSGFLVDFWWISIESGFQENWVGGRIDWHGSEPR